MTRNELLVILEQVRRTEEAITLYAKHIKNTLYLSGLHKDLRHKVKEALDTLHKESGEHRDLVVQLMEEVKKGGQDVY